VLFFARHILIDHVLLGVIEKIPVYTFLHWDIEQVDKHQLAVQSGVNSLLFENLTDLKHQVPSDSPQKKSIVLITLLVRSSQTEQLNSTSLSFIYTKRLLVRCLFFDELTKSIYTRFENDCVVGPPLWMISKVFRAFK